MILEFDVVFYVCEEPSSFVGCSVCTNWCVVRYRRCFVFLVEFCFLYAKNVSVLFLGEELQFCYFVLNAVYVYLYECQWVCFVFVFVEVVW